MKEPKLNDFEFASDAVVYLKDFLAKMMPEATFKISSKHNYNSQIIWHLSVYNIELKEFRYHQLYMFTRNDWKNIIDLESHALQELKRAKEFVERNHGVVTFDAPQI